MRISGSDVVSRAYSTSRLAPLARRSGFVGLAVTYTAGAWPLIFAAAWASFWWSLK